MSQISIADFAKERNQERDTVNAFIRRNLSEVEGITGPKKGGIRSIVIDSEAYRILDNKYPLPTSLEVLTVEKVEYDRLQQELDEKNAAYLNSLGMIARYQERTEQLEATIERLLQDKENMLQQLSEANQKTLLIEAKDSELEKIRALAAEQECRISTMEEESQKKDAEIERLSKRGIFRRLFGF